MFSIDKKVPLCKSCIREMCVNSETGEIDEIELNKTLRIIDKPYYKDYLQSAYDQFKKEHSYLDEDSVKKNGDSIIKLYFKNIVIRQCRNKSYSDSEKEGFLYPATCGGKSDEEKEMIAESFSHVGAVKSAPKSIPEPIPIPEKNEPTEELVYNKFWCGKYTQSDLDYLNDYYAGLQRDYKIITENHRDYARKIAKASLQMDKCFDEMLNGVDGADTKYKNAREAFDSLSKSAKFSESTRSVNDVGISSFSKVAAMVEAHNWIYEHKPLKKDAIDEMIDYLSTITKSL